MKIVNVSQNSTRVGVSVSAGGPHEMVSRAVVCPTLG